MFYAHRRVAIEKRCNLIGGGTSNAEHQDERVLNHASHHHFAFHDHGRALGRAAISGSGLYVWPFILCHAATSGHDGECEKGARDKAGQDGGEHEENFDVAAAPLADVFHTLLKTGHDTIHAHDMHIKLGHALVQIGAQGIDRTGNVEQVCG